MSYAQDSGYTPRTIEAIVEELRLKINDVFGTDYDEQTFVGSNWYKYFYQIAQMIQRGEVQTSQVFQKLQDYFTTINDRIQRPSVSYPGVEDAFEDEGFLASIKNPQEVDAGKVFLCVDLDSGAVDYPAKRLQVCTLMKNFFAAGLVFMGTEIENITLSNGQQFSFAFFLPNRIPVLLRITLTKSDNSSADVPSDEQIRQAVFDNIAARYRLGWDFEPQRYYAQTDATWASQILIEYSFDSGVNWHSEIYEANFYDIFDFDLEDIAVIFN